jgi:flagellar protein FlaG
MINDISFKAREFFNNADWMRSREHYQQAVQQIQQKTDQVKEGLTLQLDESLQRVREKSDAFRTKLSFNVQKDTHRIVVRIMDTETDQVIRQIPPESMLRVSEEIRRVLGSRVDLLA